MSPECSQLPRPSVWLAARPSLLAATTTSTAPELCPAHRNFSSGANHVPAEWRRGVGRGLRADGYRVMPQEAARP